MKVKEIDDSKIIRKKLVGARKSPFKTYKELTVGESSLLKFIIYEFLTSFLGPIPGGAGFFLRKKFYPRLFKKVGKGLILGRNVVIRHPGNIIIGNNVTIDDNCLIDAKGAGLEGFVIEDNVIINRNCMIQAKAGPIRLGRRTSLGSNSVIVSLDGVELDEAVLTAAGCYISAGLYHFDDTSKPIMDQGVYAKGPIRIGTGAWLGTQVSILDGVTIGNGVIIGAGAIVNKDIPANVIAFGVPAKVIRSRV
jgi:acetyltransferase-like isoleucine patch superfamily enzyme